MSAMLPAEPALTPLTRTSAKSSTRTATVAAVGGRRSVNCLEKKYDVRSAGVVAGVTPGAQMYLEPGIDVKSRLVQGTGFVGVSQMTCAKPSGVACPELGPPGSAV